MKETRRQPEEDPSAGNARSPVFRALLWAAALSGILALAVSALHWRSEPVPDISDPYAALPFRPRVTYDSMDVAVSNTEGEPYLDTRLNLYVGAMAYSVQVGTLKPGETMTRSLRAFTSQHGESFDPATHKAILLEVRARFGGYDVHKDFPPPP
ncbi:MAG TPA: hypothetical protein VE262_00345 [Blastocatellia bacterium]|nr:hypothetical protein [Blastocatellia bacterium]